MAKKKSWRKLETIDMDKPVKFCHQCGTYFTGEHKCATTEEQQMKCKCEFEFAGPGEFRNCEAFVTKDGDSGVICPKCGKAYVNGKEVKLENNDGNN